MSEAKKVTDAQVTGFRDLRRQLVPAVADAEAQPLIPFPYLMLLPMPHYRTATANADSHGFRVSIKNGTRLSLRKVRDAAVKKGIVLGNGQIWVTGATSDDAVVHNVLNQRRAGEFWCSLALRATNLTQERVAAELFAPLDVRYAVWISGSRFLNGAMTTASHAKHIPASGPNYTSILGLDQSSDHESVDIDRRFQQVIDLFDREMEIYARTFRATALDIPFGLQPILDYCGKRHSPEERAILNSQLNENGVPSVDPEVVRQFKNEFVKRARVICANHGVCFLDMSAEPEFQVPEWLFVDGVHLTDAGHVALASVVSRHLKKDPDPIRSL